MAGKKADGVNVGTTARAHLGFMDPSGRGMRAFGSVGLSLDRPCTKLRLARSKKFEVFGPEAERGARYVRKLADYFGAEMNVSLNIDEVIPAHAGLGSGTQLAIAVGSAFTKLLGINASAREIAMVLGRGRRSGIGIGTFQTGGLLLDGGPNSKGGVAPIIGRIAFPAKWRIVLIFDRLGTALHGDKELEAFGKLGAVPDATVAELCRRTMLGIMPAAAEADFDGFAEHVGFLQSAMGEYFASVQGGHYTSAKVAEVIEWARKNGFKGIGQSSWGPTGVIFVENEELGERLIADARQKWPQDIGLEFELANGFNQGASVEFSRNCVDGVMGQVDQPA